MARYRPRPFVPDFGPNDFVEWFRRTKGKDPITLEPVPRTNANEREWRE